MIVEVKVTFHVTVPDEGAPAPREVARTVYEGLQLPGYLLPGWDLFSTGATQRVLSPGEAAESARLSASVH